MEDEFTENIINMYKQDEWENILNLNIDNSNKIARYLSWVWPSKENLEFLNNIVKKQNLNGVLSIGCGSGLFEWLLHRSTNVSVIGLEIDHLFWTSKYSKPKFIPLNFITMPIKPELIRSDYALLFCYFNNESAFKAYVRIYSGNLIFIIGPGKGRDTLTNPEPFAPNFETSDWKLLDYQEVRDTKDFIAAYTK